MHEDALAEYKAKVEQDMKEFEVQRKAEMEKVKSAATEEEKKRIMVCWVLSNNPDPAPGRVLLFKLLVLNHIFQLCCNLKECGKYAGF